MTRPRPESDNRPEQLLEAGTPAAMIDLMTLVAAG
jgi:hypothetical protein